MNDKQTRCPNCLSCYKVTVPQLTVAHGRVCCPKCQFNFNALSYLLPTASNSAQDTTPNPALTQDPSDPQKYSFLNRMQSSADAEEQHVLDIFKRKVKHSDLDLQGYLNHLNYYEHHPVYYYPALNLSKSRSQHISPKKSSGKLTYYLAWSLINTGLIGLFIFQILWFNPSLLDHNERLNIWFNEACLILHCETIDQRYQQIHLENLVIRRSAQNQTEFSGVLLSQYPSSLKLPQIKVMFKKNQQRFSHIILADEYLTPSLHGIGRIPTQQPYPVQFTLSLDYDPAMEFEVHIIHP